MSLVHPIVSAAIAVGVNLTLGSRRIGFGNWQFWSIHALVICAIFLGGMR